MGNGHQFTEDDVNTLHDIVHRIKTSQLLKMLDVNENLQKSPGYIAGYSSTRADFGLKA